MLKYPREINVLNYQTQINTERFPKSRSFQKPKDKSNLSLTCENDTKSSLTEFPQQVLGVNIRQPEANETFKLTPFAGQLRTAYSQIEGLDAFANKESQDSSLRELDRSKDTLCANEKPADVRNSRKTNHSSEYLRSGLTQFEQTKLRFMKKHQTKSEIRSGKRVGFYRLILDIGRGNFSKVKLANHSLLNISVAVKVIDRTKFNANTRRLLAQELSNMELLNHPHIIKVFEVHERVQRCYLVMEYAPAGELHSYLRRNGRMEDGAAKNISAQIVSALKHMHDSGVIHRDLKAENILFFTPYFVKLGDFGFSKESAADAALTTFCGSPSYAAPELFVGKYYFGPAVDLWALGVLLFFMVVGNLPFRGDSLQAIKQSVLDARCTIPGYVNSQCRQLIEGLLCRSVEQRLRIDQVQRHSWYTDQVWLKHATAPHPSKQQADPDQVRTLLDKWWTVDELELNKSLAEGPKNPLTGIYRILLSYGKIFEDGRTPHAIEKHKKVKKVKNKEQKEESRSQAESAKKKHGKLHLKQEEELTTVDLRDFEASGGFSDKTSQKSTRLCTIS